MVRFAGVSAVAVLAGTLLGGPAWAGVETYLYAVEHPTYGNIGTYTNTVLRSGDNVQVKTQLHIAVKVLGVRLFHQDADRTEEWKDGRLVAFHSDTDDNGKKIDVSGTARGGNFVILSPRGTITAPPQVHPSNPWAPQVLDTDMMMSSKTGQVLPVSVTDTGLTAVDFDGKKMQLHQFFVDSDKHQVVWVDDNGVVQAFQTEERGTRINFVLMRRTAESQQAQQTQQQAHQ
ncbi:MAG TPA: DUF6134 family protein [Stellaceae bacterium]|jgi:Domain of unknown function (DUF6134)|nr:DUF6134 family protein [Stellaceae bacterium]